MGCRAVSPAVHVLIALEDQLFGVAQVGIGQGAPGEEAGLVGMCGRKRRAPALLGYVEEVSSWGPLPALLSAPHPAKSLHGPSPPCSCSCQTAWGPGRLTQGQTCSSPQEVTTVPGVSLARSGAGVRGRQEGQEGMHTFQVYLLDMQKHVVHFDFQPGTDFAEGQSKRVRTLGPSFTGNSLSGERAGIGFLVF